MEKLILKNYWVWLIIGYILISLSVLLRLCLFPIEIFIKGYSKAYDYFSFEISEMTQLYKRLNRKEYEKKNGKM